MLSEKKSATKDHVFYDSIYMQCLQEGIERGIKETKEHTESKLVVAKGCKEVGGKVSMTTKGFLFRVMKYSKITYW